MKLIGIGIVDLHFCWESLSPRLCCGDLVIVLWQ